MTNKDLKLICSQAIRNDFGMIPKQTEITLLEASGDGCYILFRINETEYRFAAGYAYTNGMEAVLHFDNDLDIIRNPRMEKERARKMFGWYDL